MIHKLLIANRGEVATRVIRTAKRMGLGTVAVHSEADARALHVQEADERVAIGPAAARDSYLKIDQILKAARDSGADAVHPGYGFLSESPALARACGDAGLVFIGPSAETIALMGSKLGARRTAESAGVPVIPGSGPLDDADAAIAAATDLGYPVLLKASAGGGGIGMQRVEREGQLVARFERVREKAATYFDDGTVYLERYFPSPRHIEVQIAADCQGNVIHLGERECTIQRRHQKVLEETPSPAVDGPLRACMTAAALRITEQVGYDSLGTVEMLLAGDEFYFLEMNTRLQVEHAVTEMVTGLDLVEWQIRLALGEPLPARQDEIRFDGHAIECRIYAEDPDKGFLPSPGTIEHFAVPTGPWVRNDVGVLEGEYVTPYYDPMIAKLIVQGPDRLTAIKRMRAALDGYQVDGITTNLEMHRNIVDDPAFIAGELSTDFMRSRLGLKT